MIWNDPDIGIDWPIAADKVILSDKDKVLPRLRDLPVLFDVLTLTDGRWAGRR